MSDPKRLRDEDGALNADERRLLAAGLRPNVPRGAKRAVWVALGAQLPAAVAAASASTSGVTAVALLKSASIGLVIGATTMGGVAFVQHETAPPTHSNVPASARPSSPPSARPTAPSPAVPAPAVEVAPSTTVDEPSSPSPRAFVEPPAPPEPKAAPSVAAFPDEGVAHDRESQRIARARQLLRASRASEALGVLGEVARDFPNGELTQEREALTIQALLLAGDREGARRRAQAFLARYPRSPHAPVARRALE